MKKKLRVSGTGRSRTTLPSSLAEFADKIKRDHPGASSKIDASVANLRDQMNGGGIAVQEAQIALLTEFPPTQQRLPRLAKNMKGRDTKR